MAIKSGNIDNIMSFCYSLKMSLTKNERVEVIQVYSVKIRDTNHLRQHITDACAGFDGNAALCTAFIAILHSALNRAFLMRDNTLNMSCIVM